MQMNAEQVTDIALSYVKNKAGYTFGKVKSVEMKMEGTAKKWIVSVDVGSITEIIKTVTIDDTDGRIIGFE